MYLTPQTLTRSQGKGRLADSSPCLPAPRSVLSVNTQHTRPWLQNGSGAGPARGPRGLALHLGDNATASSQTLLQRVRGSKGLGFPGRESFPSERDRNCAREDRHQPGTAASSSAPPRRPGLGSACDRKAMRSGPGHAHGTSPSQLPPQMAFPPSVLGGGPPSLPDLGACRHPGRRVLP